MTALNVYPQIARTFRPRDPQLTQRPELRALRVAYLLTAVAILNAVDLTYTVFAHHIGMLDEVNPLTAVFLQAGLVPSFISFKILMVTCGLGMLWKMRANRLTVPACWVLLLAYAWLGMVWVEWVGMVTNIFEVRLGAPNMH